MNDGGEDKLVSLVKLGKTPFSAKVGVVGGTKVAVEVRGGVESFAIGVIRDQREIVAKALLNFENSAFVESGGFRAVLVCLENRGVYKALQNQGSRTRGGMRRVDEHKWIESRVRVPVAIGGRFPTGQRFRNKLEGLGHGVRVDSSGEPERVGIDAAEGYGEARRKFPF